MTFADWLNQELNKRDWNQSELAKQSGLARGAINHLLSGRSKSPDPDSLLKIAKAFNISVEQIYRHATLLPKVDAWVDEMNHWLVQIPTDLRGIAENNIKYPAMEGERRNKKN